MKIITYNSGAYYSVTKNGMTTYYDSSGNVVNSNVLSLIPDALVIGCATVAVDCATPESDDCCDFNILANNGDCLLANNGDCITVNH